MSEKKKSKKKSGRVLYTLMTLIFLGIFLFSGYKVFTIWQIYHTNARNVESLREVFYAGAVEHESIVTEMLYGEGDKLATDPDAPQNYQYTSFSIEPLIALNPDTRAWITIPGANIDHVVMQAEDNHKYLWRSFYGEDNDCGTVFMDYRNEVGGEYQNLIIYGHRMLDGSMFAHLDVYLDQEFYNENPSFSLYLADGEYECQVYAVYRCRLSDNYDTPFFGSAEEMDAYIQRFRAYSEIVTDVEVSSEDTIVTLSTCDRPFDREQGRLVVQAKLVKVDPTTK